MMYVGSLMTLVESVSRWAKEMLVEGRSIGKYTKKVITALVYGSMLFIGSEAFLFMSLIGTAFDRYSNQVWVERTTYLENPNVILWYGEVVGATMLLLVSSLTYNTYKALYDSYDTSEFNTLNAHATQLLGIGFVSIQLVEYIGSSITICTGSNSGSFFIVTGFHGLHVILGLILLSQQQELATIEMRSTTNVGLFYSLMYWHFVDAVWFVVILILYNETQPLF